MLFNKYHIVIFKGDHGCCRKLRLRGWIAAGLFLLIAGLVGSNVYFAKFYHQYHTLKDQLSSSEKLVDEQNVQILSMAGKLKNIREDLQRIRQFDSKLRIMINMDREPMETSSVGGSQPDDFSSDYLPIHRQELLARKMHSFLKQLNTEVRLEEVRQQELLNALNDNRELLAATPSIWPTEGWITSPFGPRRSPFTGRKDFHKGLDISNRPGTPIYAPANGEVLFTGTDGAYGRTILVRHGGGLVTRYAHLRSSSVKKGQKVARGELIAYMGNTGRSTGPHLHYEVRLNGVCVDPMRYILN
ncbi:M23 family metallopeptidase [Oleidesulfovibrio sp.]|uniref:M23 family metallopeptidase n=1 Tax=Oleidesulfovibrio sp. TaxID=2909707 RepID=UPI003A8496E4